MLFEYKYFKCSQHSLHFSSRKSISLLVNFLELDQKVASRHENFSISSTFHTPQVILYYYRFQLFISYHFPSFNLADKMGERSTLVEFVRGTMYIYLRSLVSLLASSRQEFVKRTNYEKTMYIYVLFVVYLIHFQGFNYITTKEILYVYKFN